MNLKKLAVFAGGFLFGTAGLNILSSREAVTVYTHATAAVLRAKDQAISTATVLREQAGDILADAKALNEKRAAQQAEIIEDESGEAAD